MDPFLLLRLLHVAVALALGALLLFVGRPRRVGMGRLAFAATGLAAFVVCEYLWLRGPGISPFGVIHLRYLDLFLVAPTLALVLLCTHSSRRRALQLTRPVLLLAAATLVVPLVGIYATWIEPFDLRVEQTAVVLDAQREGSAPLRIGVLADLQARKVTEHEREAVTRLLDAKPDLILVTGDLIQLRNPERYKAAVPEFRQLLSRLKAPGGVYCVTGDTDRGAELGKLIEGTGITRLENEITRLEIRDRRVTIGGIGLNDHLYQEGKEVMRLLETSPGDADVRLLMAHRPDALFLMPEDTRIDLLVSGHTHGGQVQIPFFGPLILRSDVPRHIGAGGLHEWCGRRVYVSRGVGVERAQAPRIRFLAPPEISILTLE